MHLLPKKSFIITMIFLLFAGLLFSQEKVSLEKKINELEEAYTYRFFFIDDWLSIQVPNLEVAAEQSLEVYLSDLLSETDLNFYIEEKRVYLTYKTRVISPFARENQQDELMSDRVRQRPIYFKENQVYQGDSIYIVGKQGVNSKNRLLLKGRILNAINAKPVSDVYLIDRATTRNYLTTADGEFQMEFSPGEHRIQLRGLGYKRKNLTIVMLSDGSLDLFVEERTEEIPEVSLIMNPDRNVKEAVTGVTEITTAEIRYIPMVLGERDLLKVATQTPGIITAGEGSMGYNVRGGKTDQNLIQLDQGVIYNPAHFFGMFSAFNPFTTASVDIYKGAMPSRYGGRLSSVFEVGTEPVPKKEVEGKASIGVVTSNLAIGIPLKEDSSGLLLGVRGTYANGILKLLDNEDLAQSEASFYDGFAKYSTQMGENSSMDALAYYSKDKFRITSDSLYSYQNAMANLHYEHRKSETRKTHLIGSYSRYQFNVDYQAGGNGDFLYGYELNDFMVKYMETLKLSSMHQLEYGLESKYYDILPGYKTPSSAGSEINSTYLERDKGLETSVFFEDKWNINEKWSANLGFRLSSFLDASDSDSFFITPELRTSLRYLLNSSTSLKFSLSNNAQYIHRLANNTTASPTDIWLLSSEVLKPEQAFQIALGGYKNFHYDQYELSVEGYFKRMQNALDYRTGALLALNPKPEESVLIGDGKAYGLEFLLKRKTGRLNGWLSYTYSRALIAFDADNLSIDDDSYFPSNYDRPHNLNWLMNYKFTRRYSLSFNLNYQSGRPITYPAGKYLINDIEVVSYTDRNVFRIPDYFRMDLGINIEGNHKKNKLAHSFWNISVYNLTGRNNVYNIFFVSDQGLIRGFENSIYSVPIPSISYNIEF